MFRRRTLFGCPIHRMASVLDGIAQFTGRIAEDVVTEVIKNCDLISMPQSALSTLVVKNNHEIGLTQVVRDDELRTPLI